MRKRIQSFETVTLRESGMRAVTDYEVVCRGEESEVSEYSVGFKEGKDVKALRERAVCKTEEFLNILNSCRIMSWDGFFGKHPRNVRDGTMFTFKALVNGGEEVTAHGSQNFPRHYHEFTDALDGILRESNK